MAHLFYSYIHSRYVGVGLHRSGALVVVVVVVVASHIVVLICKANCHCSFLRQK